MLVLFDLWFRPRSAVRSFQVPFGLHWTSAYAPGKTNHPGVSVGGRSDQARRDGTPSFFPGAVEQRSRPHMELRGEIHSPDILSGVESMA